MCGRFVIATPLSVIIDYIDIHDARISSQGPRYNVSPGTLISIVRDSGEARSIDTAHWGFIPGWAKSVTDGRQPINARCETVATSRLFRTAFTQRRCLIPCDGFYEWKARSGARKQPYYIHRADGELLILGGIWETWHEGDKDAVTSTAIITTPANAAIEELHKRMPLVIERSDWNAWLLGDDPAKLLVPADDNVFTWHPVDPAVGNVRNDKPALIEPVSQGSHPEYSQT